MTTADPGGVRHSSTAQQLAAVMRARAGWLTAFVDELPQRPFVTAAWLVGSIGARTADAYSDIDLVVAFDDTAPSELVTDPVTVLALPGPVLYTRIKPRNAPAGGAYRTVCVELVGLPVIVDLYLWPAATAAVPAGGRVLHHAGHTDPARSELEFMPLLDQHRTSDTTGADPDDPRTTLLLVQLAAKYHARGDHHRQDRIHEQLQAPLPGAGTTALRAILNARIDPQAVAQLAAAVAAVHRLLDLVDSVSAAVAPR